MILKRILKRHCLHCMLCHCSNKWTAWITKINACVICSHSWFWCPPSLQTHLRHASNMLKGCITCWGRVMHICVIKLNIFGSDNRLSPGRHQAIIWTNAGILLIGPIGTNFNDILIVIHVFLFTKIHLKMSPCKITAIVVWASMISWRH